MRSCMPICDRCCRWFLFALSFYSFIDAALRALARQMRLPGRAASYAHALLALIVHFGCWGDQCPSMLSRAPVHLLASVPAAEVVPLLDALLPAPIASIVRRRLTTFYLSPWWPFYAVVPLLLPAEFPAVLPCPPSSLLRRVGCGSPSVAAVRLAWAGAFAVLTWLNLTSPPGGWLSLNPTSSPLNVAYGCMQTAETALKSSRRTFEGTSACHGRAGPSWSWDLFGMDALHLAANAVMIVGLSASMPGRSTLFSSVGERTLACYLLHVPLQPLFESAAARAMLESLAVTGDNGLVGGIGVVLYAAATPTHPHPHPHPHPRPRPHPHPHPHLSPITPTLTPHPSPLTLHPHPKPPPETPPSPPPEPPPEPSPSTLTQMLYVAAAQALISQQVRVPVFLMTWSRWIGGHSCSSAWTGWKYPLPSLVMRRLPRTCCAIFLLLVAVSIVHVFAILTAHAPSDLAPPPTTATASGTSHRAPSPILAPAEPTARHQRGARSAEPTPSQLLAVFTGAPRMWANTWRNHAELLSYLSADGSWQSASCHPPPIDRAHAIEADEQLVKGLRLWSRFESAIDCQQSVLLPPESSCHLQRLSACRRPVLRLIAQIGAVRVLVLQHALFLVSPEDAGHALRRQALRHRGSILFRLRCIDRTAIRPRTLIYPAGRCEQPDVETYGKQTWACRAPHYTLDSQIALMPAVLAATYFQVHYETPRPTETKACPATYDWPEGRLTQYAG